MRITSAIILILLSFNNALGQITFPIESESFQSARLRAMGHSNIANPDLQTEMFLNPAKMTQYTGIFLFANPIYSRNSISRENNSPSSMSTDHYNSETVTSNLGITAGGCASLGLIAIGGYLDQNRTLDEYEYKWEERYTSSYPSYIHTNLENYSNTFSSPLTTITLQAGLSLGPMAFGLGGSLLKGTETNKSKSSSSSIYTPPIYSSSNSSSENEYENVNKGKSLIAGALLDLGQIIEASLSAKFSSMNSEEKPTLSINNSISQNIVEPTISYTNTTTKEYNANPRLSLSESFTLGASLSYFLSKTENSTKQSWGSYSTYPYPPEIYEERLTGKTEGKNIIGGIGVKFRVSSSTLFTAEFLIGKTKETDKSIVGSDSYTSDGITYRKGDIDGESIEDNNLRILRMGGEYEIYSGIQSRFGAEYIWIIMSDEYWSGNPQQKDTDKGITYGYLFPSAGISVDLSTITLDYTLSTLPSISIININNIPSSSYYSYFIAPNFAFRHLITATIKI
jgi:hypothetical protein